MLRWFEQASGCGTRMRHSAQLAAVKARCLFSPVNRVNPERSTIPRMLAFSRSKWTAMTGYAVAAAGMILFTQLDRVESCCHSTIGALGHREFQSRRHHLICFRNSQTRSGDSIHNGDSSDPSDHKRSARGSPATRSGVGPDAESWCFRADFPPLKTIVRLICDCEKNGAGTSGRIRLT